MDSLLIVEDSTSFASLFITRIEAELDVSVVWAKSLKEAMERIESSEEAFFLGILDLHLPDAPNGEIVDRVISKNIPTIILTGEYKKEMRNEFLAKGVLDYFIKDNISVIESVIYFIDRIRKNKNIQTLVVDDSRSFRNMVRRFLRRYGFEVREAENGKQALQLLEELPADLVLTDFQMPVMDGFTLTKKIRQKFARDDLAIIGLSSHSNQDTAAQFIKAGANDFLAKPFRNEELFCRVSQNIEIIEKYRQLEQMVSERTGKLKETHDQLKAREKHLKLIMETALDAIVSIDEQGLVTNFNPAAVRLFGFKKEEMIGRTLVETIIPKALRQNHPLLIENWVRRGTEKLDLKRRIETQAMRANGDIIDLEMAPTSVEIHGRLFLTVFIHDITERKQLVKSLQDTLEVAESANKAKSSFLANMSHEIRTPMNGVLGMIELALGTNLSDKTREYLFHAKSSSSALLSIINDILDFSKIEAGKMTIEPVEFFLGDIFEEVVNMFKHEASRKELELV
ncbi:MAG: response regulator, partial [Magnetococcales bacterium]|nr:response regulator [Magnetococcales bacterium]